MAGPGTLTLPVYALKPNAFKDRRRRPDANFSSREALSWGFSSFVKCALIEVNMASDKQTRAVQIYVANRGISVAEAMRRAGYSEATARNPKNLTQTKAWEELVEEYLPDEKLAQKHVELLDAMRMESAQFPEYLPHEIIRELLMDAGCKVRNFETNPKTGIITVWYWAPDRKAQASALDLAYKLKGKMTTKVEHSGDVPVALVEFMGGDGSSSSQDSVPQ